jgi:hypothetical protein
LSRLLAMLSKPASQPAARFSVLAGGVRFAAVLPTLAPRPAPVFAPATPVLRQVRGQGQLSLDLRPR